MSLYDDARKACHSVGIDWYDPRTGDLYPAPEPARTKRIKAFRKAHRAIRKMKTVNLTEDQWKIVLDALGHYNPANPITFPGKTRSELIDEGHVIQDAIEGQLEAQKEK